MNETIVDESTGRDNCSGGGGRPDTTTPSFCGLSSLCVINWWVKANDGIKATGTETKPRIEGWQRVARLYQVRAEPYIMIIKSPSRSHLDNWGFALRLSTYPSLYHDWTLRGSPTTSSSPDFQGKATACQKCFPNHKIKFSVTPS